LQSALLEHFNTLQVPGLFPFLAQTLPPHWMHSVFTLHGSPSLACWISLGVQVWLLVLVYPPLGVGSVMMMTGGVGVVVVGVVVVVGISPSKQEASSGLLQ